MRSIIPRIAHLKYGSPSDPEYKRSLIACVDRHEELSKIFRIAGIEHGSSFLNGSTLLGEFCQLTESLFLAHRKINNDNRPKIQNHQKATWDK